MQILLLAAMYESPEYYKDKGWSNHEKAKLIRIVGKQLEKLKQSKPSTTRKSIRVKTNPALRLNYHAIAKKTY